MADRGWTMRRFRLSIFGVPALLAYCAGALSTTEQGLSSELVVYVSFDPAAHKDRLPDGLRFGKRGGIAYAPPSTNGNNSGEFKTQTTH